MLGKCKIHLVLVLASLLILTLSMPHPHPENAHPHVPLRYKVNLQDAPIIRWAPIVREFWAPLQDLMEVIDLLPFSKTFLKDVEWYARNEFHYQDFVEEIDALSRITRYPFEKIFFLNFVYEYSTFGACTGVVMRNSDGKILHGRNLDFQFWRLWASLTATIEYYRDGKLVFVSDTIVGSVLALTVHKPGAFSAEVNTRYTRRFEDDFISVLIKNAIPTCWLIKKVAEEENTFEGAMKRLSTVRLAAPVYFVVSGIGPYEGAVIERNNDDVHATYRLTDETWFLIQTNYDRDQPDPPDDQRRRPAQKHLAQRGNKNFTKQDLFEVVMSRFPSLVLGTIETVVMSSEEGYHNTTVWYSQNPEPHAVPTLTTE